MTTPGPEYSITCPICGRKYTGFGLNTYGTCGRTADLRVLSTGWPLEDHFVHPCHCGWIQCEETDKIEYTDELKDKIRAMPDSTVFVNAATILELAKTDPIEIGAYWLMASWFDKGTSMRKKCIPYLEEVLSAAREICEKESNEACKPLFEEFKEKLDAEPADWDFSIELQNEFNGKSDIMKRDIFRKHMISIPIKPYGYAFNVMEFGTFVEMLKWVNEKIEAVSE